VRWEILAGLPDFFWYNIPKREKRHSNDRRIYQMALKYTKINQHLSLQDTKKFTQVAIFGFKIYHLATLDFVSLWCDTLRK
jgi:hypothetical protein